MNAEFQIRYCRNVTRHFWIGSPGSPALIASTLQHGDIAGQAVSFVARITALKDSLRYSFLIN